MTQGAMHLIRLSPSSFVVAHLFFLSTQISLFSNPDTHTQTERRKGIRAAAARQSQPRASSGGGGSNGGGGRKGARPVALALCVAGDQAPDDEEGGSSSSPRRQRSSQGPRGRQESAEEQTPSPW